jgi:hypothetical protein
MSDFSMPRCERCKQLQYDCECARSWCRACGRQLDSVALAADRDVCFACYRDEQD